jgi:hypothetical protein
MGDNIAQVRRNFDTFVASLSSRIAVKIILLSKSSGNLGFTLPQAVITNGGVQVDCLVESMDGPKLAAFMSGSPLGKPGFLRKWFCGITVESDSSFSQIEHRFAGAFTRHFRKGADRAYVFVTDDDSWSMTGDEFVKATTASMEGRPPKVYSFRGIKPSSRNCTINSIGSQYEFMEKITGGEAFDICLDDWSASFEKLSNSIKTNAKSDAKLKKLVTSSKIKVFLNDVELKSNEYSLNGQNLNVLKPLEKDQHYILKVEYI